MCQCWGNENEAAERPSQANGQTARDFLFPVASKIGGPGIIQDVVQEARLVDEFRFALNDLSDVVEQLRGRTVTVSRPDYTQVDCAAVDPCALSDARYELVRLHGLTGDLRGIIDRLEV